MPGLVPGIRRASLSMPPKDVDGRVKPGHDGVMCSVSTL